MLSMPDTLTKIRFYFPSSSIYSSGIQVKVMRGDILPDPIIPLGDAGEWDEKRVQLFGSVLFDEHKQKFRMWYVGRGDEPEFVECSEAPGDGRVFSYRPGYAESEDGLHWEKPNLNEVEWRGSNRNNILNLPPAAPGAPFVIEDSESGDDSHRYKMILTLEGGGMLLFSDDGIRWQAYKNGKVLFKGGRHRGEESGFDFYTHEPYVFLKDELTQDPDKRYRIYTQASSGPPHWIRRTGLISSPDARNWTVHPRPVMGPPDGATGISGQIHGTAMTLYRGYYVAFIHYCLPQPKTGLFAPRVHLGLSRDGENFNVFEDADDALIPLGPEGGWSEGGLVSGCVLPVRDEVWCYFSGLPIENCWAGSEEKYGRPTINTGFARWEIDRLLAASLKPGFSKGYLLLEPFTLDSDSVVNVLIDGECDNPKQDLNVALLDAETRRIIPGFSSEQATLEMKDGLQFKWSTSIRAQTTVIPCIYFCGKTARVYSTEVRAS